MRRLLLISFLVITLFLSGCSQVSNKISGKEIDCFEVLYKEGKGGLYITDFPIEIIEKCNDKWVCLDENACSGSRTPCSSLPPVCELGNSWKFIRHELKDNNLWELNLNQISVEDAEKAEKYWCPNNNWRIRDKVYCFDTSKNEWILSG